ncbi:MAG: ATP-binding protein [bacterium]|nr:ATP-binding protein [bacterium]
MKHTNIGSTQKFTEIKDIKENIVLLANGNACIVIGIQATNFALLSKQEQDAKIIAYAAVLNSLSFPIQIVVKSEKIDISSYIKLLDQESQKQTSSKTLSEEIKLYRDFVKDMVKVNTVLDKKFYIIISYSYLEKGASGIVKHSTDDFFTTAKATLHTKSEILIRQLNKLSLKAKALEKEELIKLYHEAFNQTASLQQGSATAIADIIAPSSIETDFRSIRVGERFYKTLFMVDYPRFVSPNWLAPLIDFDRSLTISFFIYPSASSDVLSDLRRKIAEMEATISSQLEQGEAIDPKTKAGLEDALFLQTELAKGIERLFQFGFYVTLLAENTAELEESGKALHATLSSLLLVPKTATLQMEEGFKSAIPIGQDKLYINRNMDTTSLATTFPFTSSTLTQDKGVLYGINKQNNSLIVFDRFSLENANEVVLGKSGSGKSYLIKLEIMRQFMFGTEVIVIDPEAEYEKLAKALDGEYVAFTPSSPVKINPFDLSQVLEEGENELGLKILSLHSLLKIVMGEISPSHDAILDRALVETYQQKGITTDPTTQTKTPPLMEDLYNTLSGMQENEARELTLRLEKFVKGSLSGMFNQQSNFDIKNPLTVFSIRLEEELRPIAMHIILDFVWIRIRKTLKKRILILDEAWYMMKHEDSASFVYGIAKRARKYYLGLTTITQDVEDFLTTDYGKAVLSNSSIQILLKQAPSEVDLVAKTFYLSDGEKQMLLGFGIGEGLFFAGQNHVAMNVVAAAFEHTLITSNPQELQQQEQAANPVIPTAIDNKS